MIRQRLTTIDINILARELNKTLSGKTIINIELKANNVRFQFPDIILRYCITSGCVYLIIDNNMPKGKKWLANLKGGKIDNISQYQLDRLIRFSITLFDKLGKRKEYHLYFEFFQNGNILMTDGDDIIITSLRKPELSGSKYHATNPQGFNILHCNENHSLNTEDVNKIKSFKFIQYSEMLNDSPQNLLKYIIDQQENPSPHIIKNDDNEIIGFAFYSPPYIESLTGEKIDSFLEAVTLYVAANTVEKPTKTADYTKLLKKAEKKLKAIEKELVNAKEYHKYRLYGEIILANIRNIKKSGNDYILPNQYAADQEHVRISINPALSPKKNADACFTKARKLEHSVPVLIDRLAQQKEETIRLSKLADAPPNDEAEEEKELLKPEILKAKLPFRQYKLDGGWHVYVGKSASSNDELTFSFAKKHDFWFHAWQAAGSHLVLRGPQKGAIPDKKILYKAASIAAWFSKAKGSGKAPVIYTEVRHVRKIRGVLGKVNVSREKQLMVKPEKP
ncbi:MAG: DUF814 domain-containing protein [candidate division Zixibacteria bacterium]|nr:DUF814 domain-containing protein [candidate division Zixibacteria bacterium]